MRLKTFTLTTRMTLQQQLLTNFPVNTAWKLLLYQMVTSLIINFYATVQICKTVKSAKLNQHNPEDFQLTLNCMNGFNKMNKGIRVVTTKSRNFHNAAPPTKTVLVRCLFYITVKRQPWMKLPNKNVELQLNTWRIKICYIWYNRVNKPRDVSA
jgi:hypothetical protein